MSIRDMLALSSKMIEEMNRERVKCEGLVKGEPKSVEIRRIAIRSLFSSIEGMCSRMKINAVFVGEKRGMEFSREELAKVEEKPYISVENNLKFTFEILAKVLKSDFKLDVGSGDFRDFQKAKAIRNRVTHPKRIEDLNVSQDDFDVVTGAYDWFVREMRRLSRKIGEEPKTRS